MKGKQRRNVNRKDDKNDKNNKNDKSDRNDKNHKSDKSDKNNSNDKSDKNDKKNKNDQQNDKYDKISNMISIIAMPRNVGKDQLPRPILDPNLPQNRHHPPPRLMIRILVLHPIPLHLLVLTNKSTILRKIDLVIIMATKVKDPQ
jgi:hypothetical protein